MRANEVIRHSMSSAIFIAYLAIIGFAFYYGQKTERAEWELKHQRQVTKHNELASEMKVRENDLKHELETLEAKYNEEKQYTETLRDTVAAGNASLYTMAATDSCRLSDIASAGQHTNGNTVRLDPAVAVAVLDFRRAYIDQLAELASCRAFAAKMREVK